MKSLPEKWKQELCKGIPDFSDALCYKEPPEKNNFKKIGPDSIEIQVWRGLVEVLERNVLQDGPNCGDEERQDEPR